MISDWERMESAAPTDCFSADLDGHRQIIGSDRHLQAQASSTRNIITLLRSSGSIAARRSLHSVMVERPP